MIENMLQGSCMYDMSQYADDHPCFKDLNSDTIHYIKQINKRVVGKMKDELKGKPAKEFVGLRPKVYSLLYQDEKHFEYDSDGDEVEVSNPTETSIRMIVDMEKKTAKGIKKSVKEAHVRHEHYVSCLKSLKTFNIRQNLIQSRQHRLFSTNIEKVALTAFDNKRWIEDDGVHTYAHGHWRTRGQRV
jgi:hypothetical protein